MVNSLPVNKDKCPGCGGMWSMIGRAHRCSGHLLPRDSGGGVEGGHAKTGNKTGSVPVAEVLVPHPALRGIKSDVAAKQPRAGVTPGPPEAKPMDAYPDSDRRREYMREYMRKKRAAKRGKP